MDQSQPTNQSEYQERDFVQNSMNLALTEESLKILQRYKDFNKLNGIDDWRNIQQSIRTSPKLGNTQGMFSNQQLSQTF